MIVPVCNASHRGFPLPLRCPTGASTPSRRSYRRRPSASVTSSSNTACTNSWTFTRTHVSSVSHIGLVLCLSSLLLLPMGDSPSTRTIPGLASQPEGYVARSSFTHPLILALVQDCWALTDTRCLPGVYRNGFPEVPIPGASGSR